MSLLPSPRTTATSPPPRPCAAQEAARARALARVCAGFATTISPHSAARLADLMSATTYVKAA
ncbi:hypothetical protein OG730_19660 [Streptomyces sp. NBC_01298]|uniref:hypothetical protein n=1 Tax=Streptomyces sp. NBC_01298 TaxID=2903817 RepID=UPI002E0E57ED|nr:hypothetical protein OG730_19660 [Streptomyces sp. NBC_01298]